MAFCSILWSPAAYWGSCAGMGGSVRVAQACRVDASVDLGGRDRGVAEQLLDRAQVGAAFEQVRGEAVAQGVRRHAGSQGGLADPEAQAAGDVGVGEAAAALGEEQRPLARIAREGVAAALAVAPQ